MAQAKEASFTLITQGLPHATFPWLSSFFHHHANISLILLLLHFCCLMYAATMKGTYSVTCTENEFRSAIFYEVVILARPESIPESESTPWVRVGVGVGVTQKPIDSAALHCRESHCRELHCRELHCSDYRKSHCRESHCRESHCGESHCR